MELVFLLLLVSLPFTYSVKHTLTYFITISSGLKGFPELVIVGMVDGVTVGCCDSDIKRIEARQDWAEKLNSEDPQHLQERVNYCWVLLHSTEEDLESIKHYFHQSGGVHILQWIAGCEWDSETGKVDAYDHFGYDGEDFISLIVKNNTWLYTKRAASFTQKWVKSKSSAVEYQHFLMNVCPQWLKGFLNYGNISLQRQDLPSVSLLQKTPSSPVSCHTTGFYPDRAEMFWRKDEVELHEDVDKGEILHNHDVTFQMSVDLNISSVKPEDWRRYDCVFHLSGVDNNIIITKLDRAVIKTNWVSASGFPAGSVTAVVLVLLLLLAACVTGLLIWMKKKRNSEEVSSAAVGTGMDHGFTDSSSVV